MMHQNMISLQTTYSIAASYSADVKRERERCMGSRLQRGLELLPFGRAMGGCLGLAGRDGNEEDQTGSLVKAGIRYINK